MASSARQRRSVRLGRQTELRERRWIRSQLVRLDDSRREALLLEKLAHQRQGRRFVASALRDDVEHLCFVIHRAPEAHHIALIVTKFP